ncbi:uncharacterized protein [Asterias amurensis]|uniref:uncharacterized protein n=1 Tax=Asterias amurensis TaxID=7602 RepID=UPI003AB510D8
MDTDYSWLFPKGRFSYQAKMLETQLLYSRSLDVPQEMTVSSSRSHKEFPNHSLMAIAKRELYRLANDEMVTSPKQTLSRAKNYEFPNPDIAPAPLIARDHQLNSLKQDLVMKEREASKTLLTLQKESMERLKIEGENGKLGKQLEQTLEQIGQLESRLHLKDEELASKERTISQLNNYLQDTADKQTKARGVLKDYMEELMERAETAESEMETLKRSFHGATPAPRCLQRASSQSDWKLDNGDYDRHTGNKYEYNPSSRPHPNGLQSSRTDTWPSLQSHHPSWNSPRPELPEEVQRQKRSSPYSVHPNQLGNPSLQRTVLNTPKSLHVDSGVDSYSTGNCRSDDLSRESQTRNLIPTSYMNGKSPSEDPREQLSGQFHLPLDKFRSGVSLSSSLVDTPGRYRSRDSLVHEPVIQPSANASLQELNPTHNRNSGPISDRPWDLNFLNGVMADVLEKREFQNHPPVNKSNGGTIERGQSNSGFLHASQLRSSAQGYKSMEDAHWSSSDYDEDEETELDSEVDQSTMRKTRQSESFDFSRISPEQRHRMKTVWLCVFNYLNTETLLICAQVCRDWRTLTRRPSLWRTVRLSNQKISSKFLQTISKWCEELENLYLEGLKPRSKQSGESRARYTKTTRGSLEPGLEYIFLTAGTKLRTLKIVDCSNILTERSLFLASCYCRSLYSLTFISQTDPIGHEVIWALGAGCRNIASLKIPPRQPCQQQQRLSNHCLQMIGRCWPLLLALSVGGRSIDEHGLVSIARNCPRLQVLELDHLPEVTEVIAIAMCQAGLRGLHTLILRNTLISPAAILQFNGACPQLKAISVYLNPNCCHGDNREFHNVVAQLRRLTKKRVLSDVLHVFAKYN